MSKGSIQLRKGTKVLDLSESRVADLHHVNVPSLKPDKSALINKEAANATINFLKHCRQQGI
jgi:hypothetical protein